jgi:hypothetical protein
MVWYVLFPNTLIPTEKNVPYLTINKHNYIQYIDTVKNSIRIFNSQVKWDGMYGLDEAINRFERGCIMYMIYTDDIYGYVWFNEYEDGVYLQNLFMLKSKTQKWRATELVSSIITDKYATLTVHCYADDWNIGSQNVAKKLGFVEKN